MKNTLLIKIMTGILPVILALQLNVASGQEIFRDSLYFPAGRTLLAAESAGKLDALLAHATRDLSKEIILTLYRDVQEEQGTGSNLTEARLDTLYRILIDHEAIRCLTSVQIVPVDSAWLRDHPGNSCTGRMDVVIQERPSVAAWEEISAVRKPIVEEERDTILTTPGGIKIRIPAGSFLPDSIRDFTFSIKEIHTPEEILDNNLHTVTNRKMLINATLILCFLIVPKDPSKTPKASLVKPVHLWIPLKHDSFPDLPRTIYRKSEGKKVYQSWKSSNEVIKLGQNDTLSFLSFSTTQTGYIMIGHETTSCLCCRIRIPKFATHKINIIYPGQNAVVMFQEHRWKWFTLPCPEYGDMLRVEGFSEKKNGTIFSLSKVLEHPKTYPVSRKKQLTRYIVARRHYQKL